MNRLAHPLAVAAIGLMLLPWLALAAGFTWGIATEIAILALAAISFNLLLGYTGLLSFGHGLFFGLGAYGTVLGQLHLFPDSLLLPAVTGLVAATLGGLVVGFFVLRRRGVYFSLLTMAFTALAFYLVYRWTDVTGGENGLSGLKRTPVPGIDLDNAIVFYHCVAAIVLAATWVLWRVVHAPLGTVLCAIREHEVRTRFIGYPVARYKLAAFVISAALTGLAGVLMACLKLFVSADLVHVNFSGEILAMTIFGGIGSFLGPALGAAVYVSLREWLSAYTSAWQFWFGLAFMGFILFSPEGLAGIGARVLAPLLKRRGNAAMSARVQPQDDAPAPGFLTGNPALAGTLLEVRGVTKRFGGFTAVSKVDLMLADRTLHALIGPNGAGKTSLFNTVAGMFPPEAGTIALAGRPIQGLHAHQVVAAGLARSFQITSVFPALTVRENLRLACQARDRQRLHPWRAADSLANVNAETAELVRFLGLVGLEAVPVSSLSYGGQRLVEIGLALACRPRLLLLDEPLVGLAAAERERVANLIRGLTRHMGVLLVEHDIDRVFALADRVTVMNEGEVLVDGDPATVREHPAVQRVYLGEGVALAAPPARAAAPADAEPILRVAGIDTYYGKSHILRAVSFDVRPGEVLALLGRNGAGKSSTFKSILGLVPTAAGTVHLAGEAITGLSTEDIARRGIGLVPQGRRLFSGLTVDENLRLGALSRTRGAGTHWTRARIYDRFPRIRERLRTSVELLSGGEQQMVAIARALAGNVRVLLMDEPFEGLSPAMVEEVHAGIQSLRGEVAIVIIEHHLDLVLALSDRAVVLDRGSVSHVGPSAPLREDLELRRRVLWV